MLNIKKYYLTIILVLFVAIDAYCHTTEYDSKSTIINNGIGIGSTIAAIASWERNKSILWAIIHAFFSWFYVAYFVITRSKSEKK
ncbi:hypothetical protein SAMN04488096_10278 [Mesonia phycicola]|uniref:Uncharacterized protein n=1 Tax=Mesonia phycicola TaxID=579105 RepID=A0A1M6BIV4_9FLAO|nr:hypothetical protein [Mesonia phycicola]SHI48710.1 hypothetical protein SAMN04488096_10278 [Mesonia phycicola]